MLPQSLSYLTVKFRKDYINVILLIIIIKKIVQISIKQGGFKFEVQQADGNTRRH